MRGSMALARSIISGGRRGYSAAQIPETSLSDWSSRLLRSPPTVTHDTIDALRARQLFKTLPTRQHLLSFPSIRKFVLPKDGDTLEKAHHLVYFQPEGWLDELGEDGSDTEYNPPPPYTRRMWASGSFAWNPSKPLIIGEQATLHTRVLSVEEKKGMVFVRQRRDIYPGEASNIGQEGDEGGWGVREERTHVFRPPVASSSPSDNRTSAGAPPANPSVTFTYTVTPLLLFRYSALTFNAHRIHYDHAFSTTSEGQAGCVVHGPLSATLLVELAEWAGREDDKGELRRVEYRAKRPMAVGREVTLGGRWIRSGEGEGTKEGLDLWVEQDGHVGMTGFAVFDKE